MPLCVGEGPAGIDDEDEILEELDVDVVVGADVDFCAGPRPEFSSMQ